MRSQSILIAAGAGLEKLARASRVLLHVISVPSCARQTRVSYLLESSTSVSVGASSMKASLFKGLRQEPINSAVSVHTLEKCTAVLSSATCSERPTWSSNTQTSASQTWPATGAEQGVKESSSITRLNLPRSPPLVEANSPRT